MTCGTAFPAVVSTVGVAIVLRNRIGQAGGVVFEVMNAIERGVSGSPKVLVPFAESGPKPNTISRSRGAMMDETLRNSG